jgi:dTDP-4-amino-4,6-dideoxygalactose transaminase
MSSGPRIIGGLFGLEEMLSQSRSSPAFLRSDSVLLANARSGIALLIELLSPAHVWIPSFFCGPIIKAVGECKTTVKFYEVDYDLNLTSLAWLDSIQPNDLVVLVDYFGFPCDPQHINKIRERGAWILEDACQALLTEDVGRFSDFVLSSPRKFLGVPDGGVLTLNREVAAGAVTLAPPPKTWWLKAFSAVVLRREFDLHGGDRHWFELFQRSEVEGPIGPYAMSELTGMLLRHGFDYSMMAEKRVKNYELLANELGEFALFPILPPGVVPLGFPVRIKDRDRVRQVLFRNEIYPPVHWQIQGAVPEEFSDSHRLASEIMTLPCDQRYGKDDMNRVIAVLSEEIV